MTTPWWAREITCPTCGAEPGRACATTPPCRDRVEAALVSLELRVTSLRSVLRTDQHTGPLRLPDGFVGSLNPDRTLAAVDRLEAAIIAARAQLADLGSDRDV